MRRMVTGLLVGCAVLVAGPAKGQVAWDAPLLVSPSAPTGWGVFLVDPAPGSGIGVLGTWRGTEALGYRVGLAEGPGGRLAGYGGVDVSGPITRASASFPLDVDWLTGVGLGVGDAVLISVPLGLTVGRSVEADGVWFNPYVAPRVVVDAWMGSDRPRDGLHLNLAVDLGLDVAFDPSWTIRFGASIADRDALAVGLSFRLP